MQEYQRYSPSYRMVETKQVMSWIRAGECGCIVGLRGSGKSNFIKYLQHVETQQHYLGQSQMVCIFVPINLHELTERREWELYEVILANLSQTLHASEIDRETLQNIQSFYDEMMGKPGNVLVAKRALKRCMHAICQRPTQRLVFLFDAFDAIFRELPASLFLGLRSMRDDYKDQISYIVIVAHELASVRKDDEVEPFHRLVNRNTCWLGPYTEADARQMADYIAQKRGLRLNQEDLKKLIDLSGGHAGFLKAMMSLMWSEKPQKLKSLLLNDPSIEPECQKLWDGLSDEEKTSLSIVANGDKISAEAQEKLLVRGLLRQNGNKPEWVIFSPFLREYALQQAPIPQAGTFVSRVTHTIQLEEREIEATEQEFELFAYLYKHLGAVCAQEELMKAVYGANYEEFINDGMLHTLISRLRKKVEIDPNKPRYILTVRRQGYKLVLPPKDNNIR